MFSRLGVKCQEIRPTTEGLFVLDIRKRKNLEILDKEIELVSIKKKNILKEILLSYSNKRFTHFHATKEYLSLLNEFGPSTSSEIAKHISKNQNTVWIAFEKLLKKEYVLKYGREFNGKGSTPWIYKINQKGLEYLKGHL